MQNRVGFLKTTAVGGLVFLIPLVIVVVIVGKAFDLVRGVVVAIESRVPMITIGDILVLNLIALFALFLLCFAAGLFGRSGPGRRLGRRVEAGLLTILPGYSFIKGVTDGLRTSEEQSRDFVPVVAHFDDNAQLAFEVERTPKDQVVLYLPGCPDPWSGSVIYMPADRVEPVQMSVNEALRNIRALGRGSSKFADRIG